MAGRPPLRQSPPKPQPSSWWIESMPPEQWYAKAAERAKVLNEVSTTQHIQRGESDK